MKALFFKKMVLFLLFFKKNGTINVELRREQNGN